MREKDTLNEAQKEAVEHKEGPLLVLAGAGAGKTRVITHRVLKLIEKGVAPQHILAVTFTNKAAKEMRGRVEQLLYINREEGGATHRAEGTPFVATFHSLGVHILRENARILDISRNFTIFDRNDSMRAIKEAMQQTGINPKEFEPRKILSTISKQKGNATPLSQYREDARGNYLPSLVSDVWEKYEILLQNEKALDFDDLLLKALTLLNKHESIRRRYQEQWHYVHIDEYQDTNRVQYLLAHLIAKPQNNLCAVGDIDQNIYSWRGADIDNILSFEKTYPDSRTILLEQNYRSTKTILEVSNEIIKKNKRRKEKKLFTDNPIGEKISLSGLYDESEEARFIAECAQNEIERGIAPRDIAVLYRANFQSRVLEEAFLLRDIPYQVLGVRFFERKEVKDVLSYIRAALNPDSLSDLKRIVQAPPRGIGKVTFLKMISGKEDTLSTKARENVEDFRALLVRIRECSLSRTPSETIAFVLTESGLEETLKVGTEDDLERLENIHELVTLGARYGALPPQEGIEKLLEDAALATDQDELKEERNAVKLMTVHASKGLEFNTIFITGLEEGLFPHKSLSSDRIDNEEERRLFYVALTRAKKKLFLTYASVRTIFGSKEVNIPSEFITDIDEKYIETIDSNKSSNVNNEPVVYLD